MLQITAIPRVFVLSQNGQDIRLSDPSGIFTPEQVMDFYSGTYPILTTAKIEGPEMTGDEIQYRFITTIGTKG